ncbi:hypothetical protein ACTHPH_23905 [Paenibacillus pasadenensis]|uniref:Uncharacterized protein n=1 Tax=Paenibacillus albicereus TaxID=2726185 RepID=A0A6H2H0A5_9BACL|nr:MULTISPECIES: hypothetical protein [Paenibacillus]QJC53082.1 hypothetical protein HGI30_16870 [Paenibacillus albicereus]
MAIQIQINGESAAEVVAELSVLAASLVSGKAAPVAEAPKAERALRGSRAAKADEPKAAVKEPAEESAAVEETGAEAGGDYSEFDGDAAEPIPTDVELRTIAAGAGQKGVEAKKAIKALLDKYGSANITGVPDDKRLAFKAELEQI